MALNLEGAMSRISASQRRQPRAINRRAFIEAGGMGLLGLGVTDRLRPSELQAADGSQGQPIGPGRSSSFGKAKSVMVLFLYGAPSQMDTLDPKPNAPDEVRGDFKAIATSIPGIAACELLPNIAKNLHRVCL